jgi:hypothetical protein
MLPVLLLCIVIVGVIFIACYAAYHFGKKSKVNPKVKACIEKELSRSRIIETLYDEEETNTQEESAITSRVPKIRILEKLNISPHILKSCVKQLIRDQLIDETDESISLTLFGVQYCEIFIKRVAQEQEGEEE